MKALARMESRGAVFKSAFSTPAPWTTATRRAASEEATAARALATRDALTRQRQGVSRALAGSTVAEIGEGLIEAVSDSRGARRDRNISASFRAAVGRGVLSTRDVSGFLGVWTRDHKSSGLPAVVGALVRSGARPKAAGGLAGAATTDW
jgi:hypothetical protein